MTAGGPTAFRRGFDDAAADFDVLGRHLWGPIGADTAAALDLQRGERVLDACCGTGASALPAARAVGTGGMVDAVDVSVPMVDALKRTAADLPQLHCHAADVLTWPDSGYDVVQCALGIFFFPDMEAGARRLIARARPGGRIGFTIWQRGSMEAAGAHLERAVAETDGRDIRERPSHLIHRIAHPEPYAEWLGSLGLREVEVAVAERSLPADQDMAWLVVLGSGFRRVLADRTDAQVAEIRRRYLASLAAAGVQEIAATALIGKGTAPQEPAGG